MVTVTHIVINYIIDTCTFKKETAVTVTLQTKNDKFTTVTAYRTALIKYM